jgi:hypothetical protein
VPIPDLDPSTGNLPPGIHVATWDEFAATFGGNPERRRLLVGLLAALQSLKAAGCRRVYVDGSFVSAKPIPGDFDGCWEAAGVQASLLDPTLLDFQSRRAAQKAKYGGELFIASAPASPAGTVFLDFFQRDKATGDPKGIVAIDLGGLP